MAKFALMGSLETTLRRWASLLSGGLTFGDNFSGYEWTGTLEPGEERRITHGLNVVPSRFIVTFCRDSNSIVASPTSRPNERFFYVKNAASTSTFIGKILILP